jgi:IPT/TIG domain
MKLLTIVSLVAICVGCGYSSSTMPATAGAMPTIAELVPSSTTAGAASFSLEVEGASFASNAVVNFNGTRMATTWVSAGQLMATIPASAIASSGTVPVTVTNLAVAGGQYGGGTTAETSAASDFTIEQ